MAREPGAPDSSEPLLGWRVWHLEMDGALRPIVSGSGTWAPGPNEARCHLSYTKHTAPAQGCVCGFNALHEPPEEYRGDAGHAVGVIAAWGRIDIYGTGFRSQFASVIGLLADASPDTLHARKLEAAARRYGVPVLPIADLRRHAEQYAKPVSETVLPGKTSSNLPPLPLAGSLPRRNTTPLPAAAMPDSFRGRGVLVDSHLAVDQDGRTLRLGPTPSLAALAIDGIEPAVKARDRIEQGDSLLVAEAGQSVIVVPSPVDATVVQVNPVPPAYELGPAAGGWLIDLRLHSISLDQSSIAWGRRGAEAYRELILTAGSDADLLLRGARSPRPPSGLVSDGEARGWLRAFAQLLDTAIRSEERLCAALRSVEGAAGETIFEVTGIEPMRVAAPPLGSDRWVTTGASVRNRAFEDRPKLRIELTPEALNAYWRGGIGLGTDDVSEGEPGARADHASRNPLHLTAGDRGALRIANSLHRRAFAQARDALDGLGNPWFRAGDAVRDPVRNLKVLAGFEPPSAIGGAGAA